MLAGMLTLAEGLRTFLAVSHLPAISRRTSPRLALSS